MFVVKTNRGISRLCRRKPQEQAALPGMPSQGSLQGGQPHGAHAGAQQVQLWYTGSTSSPAMTRPLQMSQSWSFAVSGSIFPSAVHQTAVARLQLYQPRGLNSSWSQDADCPSPYHITQSRLDGSQKCSTKLNKTLE